jgi:hypothetical protein
VRGKLAQVRIRETNESEPFEDASLKTLSVVKTRGGMVFWDKLARSLMTERVATGVEKA